MQIGVVGLGRMGGNISRRLMKAGHRCIVFDTNLKPREALAKEGATAAGSLADLVKALGEKPRAVWVMLPAGEITTLLPMRAFLSTMVFSMRQLVPTPIEGLPAFSCSTIDSSDS